MFVSGMGFFTDAYHLFVIGIVVALLRPEWGLSTSQVSLLNSATLAASAVGASVFGRIADISMRRPGSPWPAAPRRSEPRPGRLPSPAGGRGVWAGVRARVWTGVQAGVWAARGLAASFSVT